MRRSALPCVCGLQVCQQSCQSSDDGEEPNMGAGEQQMASLELKGWEGECTSWRRSVLEV